MNRCPICGRYMNSYMEYIFDGARCIWTCTCGYTTKGCSSGMSFEHKTNNPVIMTNMPHLTQWRSN